MIYDTSCVHKFTILKPDAIVVTGVISDTLRLVGSPLKSQRKVAQKGSVACVPRDPSEKVTLRKWNIEIESHSQTLEGHVASRIKIGKRRVRRRESCQ